MATRTQPTAPRMAEAMNLASALRSCARDVGEYAPAEAAGKSPVAYQVSFGSGRTGAAVYGASRSRPSRMSFVVQSSCFRSYQACGAAEHDVGAHQGVRPQLGGGHAVLGDVVELGEDRHEGVDEVLSHQSAVGRHYWLALTDGVLCRRALLA